MRVAGGLCVWMIWMRMRDLCILFSGNGLGAEGGSVIVGPLPYLSPLTAEKRT